MSVFHASYFSSSAADPQRPAQPAAPANPAPTPAQNAPTDVTVPAARNAFPVTDPSLPGVERANSAEMAADLSNNSPLDTPATRARKSAGGRPKDYVWTFYETTDDGELATCKNCGWQTEKPKAFRIRQHISSCPETPQTTKDEIARLQAQREATKLERRAVTNDEDSPTEANTPAKKRVKADPALFSHNGPPAASTSRVPILSGPLRSAITCHVLDSTTGKPGTDMEVRLDKLTQEGFSFLRSSSTNADGRCQTLLEPGFRPEIGIYKLTFMTNSYFTKRGVLGFYPFVEITFEVKDPMEHYHIPLLLSPFSYSTYRGS
ncbi:uncharacterized protein L969DRAFT_87814 [Mixia osmundae IAM 14324]|uniref:uncharacterized protein n=1 Tax=Mixia osmundae (strain CBS 9802 / IAM 14324 / JCM 22182 / KY 12970) TaxID=764103 RepID=UPI0004A54C07|nr:uncharacterized protein L969DRAFT_87814 [Mixia osmundae IAM 14324]KEI38618.1 hypothetical protein L969DRAFT_87814 [Mixia osmundae IAM 14324]